MTETARAIHPLVQERLELIAGEPDCGQLGNMIVLEPAFYRDFSVVFYGLFWTEDKEVLQEILVEISNQRQGCLRLRETLLAVMDVDGMPGYFFSINQGDTYIGLVYTVPLNTCPYELYLPCHQEAIYPFFLALKEMIQEVHQKGVLMPPAWIDSDLLFVDAENRPHIIGYNGIRPCDSLEELALGCHQDWRSLLTLFNRWEIWTPAKDKGSLRALRQEVKSYL